MDSTKELELTWGDLEGYQVVVPFREYLNDTLGHYTIIIEPTRTRENQQHGNYQVNVLKDKGNPYFLEEGFPRYYFDLNHAKAEIQAWVNSRYDCARGLMTDAELEAEQIF